MKSVFLHEVIEQEINWCESHRGMESDVYENAFIAGLKQVLLFINSAEQGVYMLSEGQIIEEWSDWYDKHFDEIEQASKNEISQMAFYAGVTAAQQSVQSDTLEACAKCGRFHSEFSRC